MQGVLVISHGELAKGLVDSAKFIFGENIPQLSFCCYDHSSSVMNFDEKLRKAYASVDGGDGVIVLVDILGGVCYKRALLLMDEQTEIIVGANLSLVLEILTKRMSNEKLNIDSLIEKGREGMFNVRNHANDLALMVE